MTTTTPSIIDRIKVAQSEVEIEALLLKLMRLERTTPATMSKAIREGEIRKQQLKEAE